MLNVYKLELHKFQQVICPAPPVVLVVQGEPGEERDVLEGRHGELYRGAEGAAQDIKPHGPTGDILA